MKSDSKGSEGEEDSYGAVAMIDGELKRGSVELLNGSLQAIGDELLEAGKEAEIFGVPVHLQVLEMGGEDEL